MLTMKSRIALSYNVAERRRMLNLSQRELAARADVSPRYISRIEKAYCNITLEYVDSLAEALEVTAAELLDATKVPEVSYRHMLLLDERQRGSRRSDAKPDEHSGN